MKKIIAAIVLSSLLLTIAGCKKNEVETGASTSALNNNSVVDTTVSKIEENATPIKQIPMASVAMPVVKQSAVAQDGTVIFNSVYQNMALITQDPEVADKIIIDYLNQTDINDSAATMQAQAESAYKEKPAQAPWSPYLYQITYDPMRIDQGVLSLFGACVTYTGAVHADFIGRSITYDLTTGQQVFLEDVFTESVNAKYICNLVLNALSSQEGMFKGYETTVKDRFNENFLEDEDWYFSNTGLCFYFSPYEIASYADGIITAEIPYSALTDIIKDAYFPSERENARGTVQISTFNENSLSQFSQFSEVVLEEGTDKILLHSENGVYDVRIETGSWSADGLTFTPEYTVFASYALTPGDAIMVDSPLSETLPKLRLSYSTDEKTVSYFIITNGDSGNVELLPA